MDENKSGLYIVAIVAVIAVVAMVIMVTGARKESMTGSDGFIPYTDLPTEDVKPLTADASGQAIYNIRITCACSYGGKAQFVLTPYGCLKTRNGLSLDTAICTIPTN